MIRVGWTQFDESERSACAILSVFLTGRLASIETVNWALQIEPNQTAKQTAMMQVVDSQEGRKVAEPWRTVWRLIEEYWVARASGRFSEARPYDIGTRVKSGERSGALLAAITDLVAPRLRVSTKSTSQITETKAKRKLKTVADIVSAGLTSGHLVDPQTIGLDRIDEASFLTALANSLENALARGLDTARRLGWDGETKLYQLGLLYRAYFINKDQREALQHEPDEFHTGIASCAKVLHFVIERLARLRDPAAIEIATRLKLTQSPVHLRLWAAVSRDPWVTSANDVSGTLEKLDNKRFWDVQNLPEIAELRAVRFAEFEPAAQDAIIARIMKLPPRSLWPRGTDRVWLSRAQVYLGMRELRRIEIAGGVMNAVARTWFDSEIMNFPELAQMNRIDDGFIGTSMARYVPPNPDARFDGLVDDNRLHALESAIGSGRGSWDHSESEGAIDWMRQADSSIKLIRDLEASAEGGAAYPNVWEQFGWAHKPASEKENGKSREEIVAEAKSVLRLLARIPDTTAQQAIEGISEWLSTWRSQIVRLPEGFALWERLWPQAVEATNLRQSTETDVDLNLISPPSGDSEPLDLDTLNTPSGN
jgi:hypothetical protein